MKTLTYGKAGGCILLVCGKKPPEDDEWDEYIRFLEMELVPGSHPIGLVFTEGGGPTAPQRQRMNDLISRVVSELKAVVLSTSHFSRGIVTALNWANPEVHHTFHPDDIDIALGFLGVPGESVPSLKEGLSELREKLKSS